MFLIHIMSIAAMLLSMSCQHSKAFTPTNSNLQKIIRTTRTAALFSPTSLPSSSSFKMNPRRLYHHYKAIIPYQTTTSSLTTLHAIESRELRFYNGSTTTTAATTKDNNMFNTKVNSNNNSNIQENIIDVPQQLSYFASLFPQTNSSFVMKSKRKSSNNKKQQPFKNSFSTTSSTTSMNSKQGSGNASDNVYTPYSPTIHLTPDEKELFDLLSQVIESTQISSTLRVAGGWVRDKLLATEEFQRRGGTAISSGNVGKSITNGDPQSNVGLVERLTSKYRGPSAGRQGSKLIGLPKELSASSAISLLTNDLPVDIDIALDDMLGREFADHLNEWLTQNGQETISVGVVLKNPEKSKHLETATMKVGKFWIDFVNLRAEEYTEDSRIPDLMRIGTAEEDALRRDLTINALFYNINTGQVEDFTGKGFDDLKKGIISTPLPALTTLLDDPLRVLRSVRFAARLRFTMEESLREAATNEKVRVALAQKVARERIGAEVDLMLRSQDPVGAMRLLINLNLAGTVFSMDVFENGANSTEVANIVFSRGLKLLSVTHDHLVDCKVNVPIWCEKKRVTASSNYGVNEVVLMEDEELRRKLWYASFLKPLRDESQMMLQHDKEKIGRRQGKKANRSVIMKLMVDELKRPVRDAETVETIMKGADDFTNLLHSGCDLSSTACLLGNVRVINSGFGGDDTTITCIMGDRVVDCESEDDPLWEGAMEYRLLVSRPLKRLGPLWRAAMILSLSEQLAAIEGEEIRYTIEGDVVSR